MNKLDLTEVFALGQWLSDYPDDKTYNEIIEMLENDDDENITAWEVVEDYPLSDVALFIEDTRISARRLLRDSKSFYDNIANIQHNLDKINKELQKIKGDEK